MSAQIDALNAIGESAKGFFFTFENRPEGFNDTEKIHYEAIGNEPLGLFRTLKAKKYCYAKFEKWLENNFENFDVIYVRYHLSSYQFYKICKKYGSKIAIEYQTKNIDEINSFKQQNPFGMRPSKLLSWLEHQFVPLYREKIWGKLVLGKIKYIVGVTNEITNYQKSRAWAGKPHAITISNGISTEACNVAQWPTFNGSKIILAMLVGSVEGSDWNGIDLVVKGIQAYTGNVQFEFWLCGDNSKKVFEENNFFKSLGYCNKAQIADVLHNAHAMLGAFALERKKISEGSTLKMREYLAAGKPVVYGYSDTDADKLAERGLLLKCKPCEVPIVAEIAEYVTALYNNENAKQEIRNFAEMYLDFKVKMLELANAIGAVKQ